MNKTEIVRMRITPEDKSLLKEEAAVMSSTISEYMEYKIFCKEIPRNREMAIHALKELAKQNESVDVAGTHNLNTFLAAVVYWIDQL